MKRLIKFLVIFTILIALFAIDVPYILSVFSLDEKLKNYIIENINTESEKVVSIEDMKIGLWTVEANDITIISSTQSSQFVIKNIKFNYNILKLLTDSSNPQYAVKEVVLIEPKLILKQSSIESNIEKDITQISDSIKIDYIEKITSFTGINKVQLQNAKVIFKKDSGELLVIADKLNGWMKSDEGSNITLSAEGSVLYGIDNFKLFFDIDLKHEQIAGRVELGNYDIKNTKYLINKSDLFINKGNLDGRLYISSSSFDLDSLTFNGYLNITELNGNYGSTKIDNFNAYLTAVDNNMKIQKCNGFFNGSNFKIGGKLFNIYDPIINLSIESKKLYLSSLEPYLESKGFNGSQVALKADLKMSRTDTTGNISISAKSIKYNNEQVNDFDVFVKYDNNKLNIQKFNLRYLNFNLSSFGKLNIDNGNYSFRWQADRKFGTHLLLDELTNKTQEANLNLNGNIFDKSMNGTWNYSIHDSSNSIYDFSGIVNLKNEIFTFTKSSKNQKDFQFSFQFSDIFTKPSINYGYIENFPFDKLSSRSWIRSFFNDFSLEGILVGPLNSLNTELRFYSKKDKDSEFIVTSKIENILDKEKNVSGTWEINDFIGNVNFKLGEEYLLGTIKSGKYILGEININLNRSNQLSSKINLDEFDIGLLFKDNKDREYGNLSGTVNANGNLDNPQISASLKGDKFVFNDIGYYKFDTKLSIVDSTMDISSLKVSLNNSEILEGEINVNLTTEIINATASGKNVDAEYIFRTIFDDTYKMNGFADYDFEMHGSYRSPNITAVIDFKEGDVEGIAYDKLQIALSDSILDNSQFFDYKKHLINIKNFTLVKNGHYHFESKGTFPLYKNGDIDLNLNFTGDLFSLIPRWSSFIVDGASFTSINLKLSGTPEKIRILKGEAEIEQGELWLASVAEHIDDVSGKIELIPESNRVNFVNFKAGIDGNYLVINTVHDIELKNGEQLKPWYFKNIDLDFGVLILSTPEAGIELDIPSLMGDGEKGRLSLSGKVEGENFYFSGPVKHPVVRGKVMLSDSRVTYPFPPKKSKEKDSAEEFLENVNWDLLLVAGKDLIYQRDIDAFLDEVNTELYVNPEDDGLEFTGTINRNTFKVNGNLTSDRGRLDYLDLNFRVESFGVEFNEQNQEPRVTGRAWTMVRDSVDAIPKTIYLQLFAVDKETGQEIQSARWEDFRFKLVSADPTVGETQEQVLAYLGYSVDNIQNKATEVGGAVTENYLIRPLLRPIERTLERYLGFDLVRFNSNIAKNIFHVSLGNVPGFDNSKSYLYNLNNSSPYLFLFESSELTVGKYLSQDLYLTYTGQLVATSLDQSNEFNFNHSIGLEYRFFKNILVEFEYDREMLKYFSTFTDKPYYDDFKIRLRHSFSF